MAEFDLEKLQDIKVPEAKLSAKQHTLQSALSEFDEQQKRKGRFSLSALLPDWLKPSETSFNILNPGIAGTLSLLVVIGLGSVIYLPEIAKQPKPEEITKEQDIRSEETISDKAEEKKENGSALVKPQPAPIPLTTPGIQKLKKKISPQQNLSDFGNRKPEKFHQAPARKRKLYSAPKSAPSGMRARQYQGTGNSIIIGQAAKPEAGTKTFNLPLYKGKALHHCLLASDQCGQIVADRFCSSQKMGKAKSFQIEQKTASETISIQDNTIYKSTGNIKPLTFKSITCSPAGKN